MDGLKEIDKKPFFALAAQFSLALSLAFSIFYFASIVGLRYSILSNRGVIEQTVNNPIFSGQWDAAVWSIAILIVLCWVGYHLRMPLSGVYDRPFLKWVFYAGIAGCFALVGLVIFSLVSLVSLGFISIWLACLLVAFSSSFFRLNQFSLLLRLFLGSLLFLSFVELASLATFSAPTALGSKIGGVGLHWNAVRLGFSNLAYPLLPYAYLVFAAVGIIAFIYRATPDKWMPLLSKVKNEWLVNDLTDELELGKSIHFGLDFLSGRLIVFLAVIVSSVICFLFVAFTVLPWNNPTGMMVSVDSPVYYQWVNKMRSLDANSAISFAFGNDRALFLLILYTLSYAAPLVDIVQFAAALLLIMLTLATVFVMQLFTSSNKILALSALLVPFSVQGLGLIYSGFFANLLALILILVYIVLFFRLMNKWSSFGFFAMLGISVLVLFSHSWTWFIFALSLGMFLLLEWRKATGDAPLWARFKNEVLAIGATLVVGFLIDALRTFLSPTSSSGSALITARSSLGFPTPAYLLAGMKNAVDIILGGVFANQLLVILSFVGFFVLLKLKGRSAVSNFFVAWIFVACVSIVFAAENFVFVRALFMLPWIVLSALGLAYLALLFSSKVSKSIYWQKWAISLILAFVFLALINQSVQYLFNINIF